MCIYIAMYIFKFIFISIFKYIGFDVFILHVYVYIHMYAYMSMCIYVYIPTCIYAYMYMCMYICVYVCIYIYTYICYIDAAHMEFPSGFCNKIGKLVEELLKQAVALETSGIKGLTFKLAYYGSIVKNIVSGLW